MLQLTMYCHLIKKCRPIDATPFLSKNLLGVPGHYRPNSTVSFTFTMWRHIFRRVSPPFKTPPVCRCLSSVRDLCVRSLAMK